MTSRRSFLRTLGLASAGAVLVGPDVLEAFARLTHVRKSFPSAGVPQRWYGVGHYLDVRDFGAVGDGIAYDLPAIQRAIDAAGRRGGTVVFPSGTYNTIRPLTLPNNVRLA